MLSYPVVPLLTPVSQTSPTILASTNVVLRTDACLASWDLVPAHVEGRGREAILDDPQVLVSMAEQAGHEVVAGDIDRDRGFRQLGFLQSVSVPVCPPIGPFGPCHGPFGPLPIARQ